MKSSTLNTLLVAKAIHAEAKDLVNSGDKHNCTAGIILLQDFVELIILAALDELDVDEQRSLESKSFDELIGELKKQGVPIVKSGTIKALNKQRVICKHYGQLTDADSAVNYFKAADIFVDAVLKHVLGKGLQEVFMTDLLKDGDIKKIVTHAVELADKQNFMAALIELRKAFFLAYEREYSIYDWKGFEKKGAAQNGLLGLFLLSVNKAHEWKKNKQWIEANVAKPTDYVQIDYERLKFDCIEWGLSTVHVENFRRLTPEVVQTEKGHWHTWYNNSFVPNESNLENFNYCLDLLLEFLLKKQEFDSKRKWPKSEKSIQAPPIYVGKPLYEKPSQQSAVIDVVKEGYFYMVLEIMTGFESNERYLLVRLYQEVDGKRTNQYQGYLLVD